VSVSKFRVLPSGKGGAKKRNGYKTKKHSVLEISDSQNHKSGKKKKTGSQLKK